MNKKKTENPSYEFVQCDFCASRPEKKYIVKLEFDHDDWNLCGDCYENINTDFLRKIREKSQGNYVTTEASEKVSKEIIDIYKEKICPLNQNKCSTFNCAYFRLQINANPEWTKKPVINVLCGNQLMLPVEFNLDGSLIKKHD